MSEPNPFKAFVEGLVGIEPEPDADEILLEDCLDENGIPHWFKKDENPDWRGREFITLCNHYPQLPHYGTNCRRMRALLDHEKPQTLDAALELIREGMNKCYSPLLSQHNENRANEFGRWRTTNDATLWPFNLLPRYCFANRIIMAENQVGYTSAIMQSMAKDRAATFPKTIDGLRIGNFSLRHNDALLLPPIHYLIPKVDSKEWGNCQTLGRKYFAEALNKEIPTSARLEAAFKCYQLFSCWAPFERGSSTTAMILLAHMTKEMGLTLPPQRIDRDLNVIAICTPFEKFYRDCQHGEHYELISNHADLAATSKHIHEYNQTYDYLAKNDLVWPELISDLHHSATNVAQPTLWNYAKLYWQTHLDKEKEYAYAPVILSNDTPGIRINTRKAYDYIYAHGQTDEKMIPPAPPEKFPIFINIRGQRFEEKHVQRYAAMDDKELQTARTTALQAARLSMLRGQRQHSSALGR